MNGKINSVTFKKTKKGKDMWDLKISNPEWNTADNVQGERTFHCWRDVTKMTGQQVEFDVKESTLKINGKDVIWKTLTKINGQAYPHMPDINPSVPQQSAPSGWTMTPAQVETALKDIGTRLAALEKAFAQPMPDDKMPL